MTDIIKVVLFLPAVLLGFLFECARPGFECGIEIAEAMERKP